MYTDEDLNLAVKEGIFTNTSVEAFRGLLANSTDSPAVDEENFRLIGGFNDIFIVIACSLLLFSSVWVLKSFSASLGFLVFTVLAWGLAEFFVLKRKMALPAIVLLLAFIGGVFTLSVSLFSDASEVSFIVAFAMTSIAAYAHWRRFSVPITAAVGAASLVGVMTAVTLVVFPAAIDWLLGILFVFGMLTFALAMVWDAGDTQRITYRADVGFWLHLLSAPLIIHPVFSGLGILTGSESLASMAVVIAMYLLMTCVSIVVDRRAFMVSALVYVLYAISSLITAYGGVGSSFALTGVVMGGSLLLLSAYWHSVRVQLVSALPSEVKRYVPEVQSS